jgi:hypothetical protein
MFVFPFADDGRQVAHHATTPEGVSVFSWFLLSDILLGAC